MLTVDDYIKIRRARRDGMSIRAISKTFRHSRLKIRQVINEPQPKAYTRSRPASSPKLDSFKPIIDHILRDDEKAPLKQRHTAAQIARRLHEEDGFVGSYDIW